MSLPISRRIVQAAVIVAAGAVPAVAAGTAVAAPALPTPDLGGLSQLNSMPDLNGSVESTAHQTGELAGSSVGQAASEGLPVVADAAGHAATQAVPLNNRSLGDSAMSLVGTAAQAVSVAHGAGVGRSMPAAAEGNGTTAGDTPAVAPAAPAPAEAPAAAPAAPSSPLSALPLQGLPAVSSLPLGSAAGALGGARSMAPTERLGGALPSLGGGQSPLNGVTGAVPGLSGLPLGGLPVNGLPVNGLPLGG